MLTELNDNFSFRVNERTHIEFTCPNKVITTSAEKEKFPIYDFLVCTMFDKNRNEVELAFREKMTSESRVIRMVFTPGVAGIYKLSIKYCGADIAEGPFSFVVMPQAQNITQSDSNSSFMSATNSNGGGGRLSEFLGGNANAANNGGVDHFRVPVVPENSVHQRISSSVASSMSDRLSTPQTIASS